MWNILLDKLPEEYAGFPINSDFRVGIQMFQALNDNDLSEMERIHKTYDLLFLDEDKETGESIPFKDENGQYIPFPDIQTAQDGIIWFLTGWQTDKPVKSKGNEKKDMDYDIDQWRIYSAFLTQYKIDLNEADMHFWSFMGLLTNLEECSFTRVVDVRTKKIDPKMAPSDKKALKEVKQRYSLDELVKVELSPEEQKRIDDFMKYFD